MFDCCTCNDGLVNLLQQDTEILEKLVQDDIAAAKTPVALVAYAGKLRDHKRLSTYKLTSMVADIFHSEMLMCTKT